MKAIQLRTEYLENPLGIDQLKPRFTWQCQGGVQQKSFQVRVYDEHGHIYDDSGIIESSNMYYIYGGLTLSPKQQLFWQVKLTDQDDVIEVSEVASFEMGFLDAKLFDAAWISGVDTNTSDRLPADYFFKTFTCQKNIKRARLYITALGTYEASINGEVVSDFYLAPGSQQYDKRLYYQIYDVKKYLQETNDFHIILGDGWYKGKLGCDSDECLFGQKTMVKAQLEVIYEDGLIETVKTDKSFMWSNDGVIRYNDIKDGVVLDFNKTITYQTHAIESPSNITPSVSVGPKLKIIDYLTPELLISPSGKTILDFKQNFAGSLAFTIEGKKNQKVSLRAFEVLNHGEYCDSTFRTLPNRGKSINQEIAITLSGKKDNYVPNFHYFGFRYVLVEGLDNVNPDDFKGVVVSSHLPYQSSFKSSNELLNKFVENTIWSLKSNFFDVPTDCPHREKAGWTGDAQIISKTACYLTDPMSFYRKWLRDVKDCQRDDGRVHNINPKVNPVRQMDMLNGSSGWADAVVIIPYTLWKFYGDSRIIEENLDLMLGWKKYIVSLAADKSIYDENSQNPLKGLYIQSKPKDSPYNKFLVESGFHWGEWSEPLDVMGNESVQMTLMKPKREEATAYLSYSMNLLSEMLAVIGYDELSKECEDIALGAQKAYHMHFVDHNDIVSERQAKLVRPLALGLLDSESEKNVSRRLNQSAIDRNYRVGTGFLSTPFLLPMLAKHGYVETAYKTMLNTETPAWLGMVKNGATTVWESYEGFNQDGEPLETSMNHYSLGAMVAFLFEYVSGITIRREREFVIQPLIHQTLSHIDTIYQSPYGKVTVSWQIDHEKFMMRGIIPSNTHAHIVLPNGDAKKVVSGEFEFSCTLEG